MADSMPEKQARLSIRIDLAGGRFGPGKAALLRAIAETGSIAEGARRLGMSYARAWKLTADMNALFREPLVETFAGGNRRGGARLTALGERVLRTYATIVAKAEREAARALSELASLGG
jgi:molybdate transport system regulatory protein